MILELLMTSIALATPVAARTGGGARVVQLSTERPVGFAELAVAFQAANPGYRSSWRLLCTELSASESAQVAFVQAGSGRVSVGAASSDCSVGDVVLLRASESASFDPACDLVVFDSPVALPAGLPWIIRPDWDPKITDTPGGCATESGAYRRILLTWENRNGPYVYHALNAHRVRIADSFTHYHPLVGGFDEFYLVQHASPGAKLWIGEDLDALLESDALDVAAAQALLRPLEVHAGDLVYLPRGVVHRGTGGILAQVITVPGFVPGAEIGVDERLVRLNARLGLSGDRALPFHQRAPQVAIVPHDDVIEITIAGKPFTSYRFGAGDPCFFPVFTPAGTRATRAFPLEMRDGEARDHPHHRSIWFAHGAVNGHDFWTEGPAVVRQTRLVSFDSGEGRGAFEVEDDWIGSSGTRVATDRRLVEAFALDGGAGLDFDVTMRAGDVPLVFGDTKEGTMAVRLAAGLAMTEGGALLDSEGRRGDECWGKRSRWVLASGTTSGASVAVAMFDHPSNPRHPTTWHARNYGLIAANPFGLSDFEKAPKGSGELRVAPHGELRLRYRMMFFDSPPSTERLDAHFADFAAAK